MAFIFTFLFSYLLCVNDKMVEAVTWKKKILPANKY